MTAGFSGSKVALRPEEAQTARQESGNLLKTALISVRVSGGAARGS